MEVTQRLQPVQDEAFMLFEEIEVVGPRPSFEETLVVFLGLRQAGRRWSTQAKLRSWDLTCFVGFLGFLGFM
jgi:hypothetical protein